MRRKKVVVCNFIVPMVIYPFDLMVSIGQSDVQLGKCLDRYDGITEEDINMVRYPSDRAQGRACMFSTNQSVLRLRKLPESSYEYGVMAHEIFHIATFVMDRIGMKLVIMESDEAYAYLVGYITEQIYSRINRYY